MTTLGSFPQSRSHVGAMFPWPDTRWTRCSLLTLSAPGWKHSRRKGLRLYLDIHQSFPKISLFGVIMLGLSPELPVVGRMVTAQNSYVEVLIQVPQNMS